MITKGTPILISLHNLLDYVSQEEIAYRYVTGFKKIGESFKSEFRTESISSSRVWWGKYGYLMFKDFGDPNLNNAITVIEYVQHKYNLNKQAAINKIAIDFGLVDGKDNSLVVKVKERSNKVKRGINSPSDLVIKIKKREWGNHDKKYWNQYFINTKLLERNKIVPISHVFYNNYAPVEYSKTHHVYSYNYYWSNNIFRRKIYQPFSKREKWRTNTDYTVVQNYPNIPKEGGDLLFIQSSYKDCMVMELLGYHSIAPNTEGSWVPDYYWDKLKERWKNIVIFWDNDWEKEQNSGVIMAQNYSKMYDIPYIITPNIELVTDISDFVKEQGLDSGKDLLNGLIKEIK